jgi:hypothetical protein
MVLAWAIRRGAAICEKVQEEATKVTKMLFIFQLYFY